MTTSTKTPNLQFLLEHPAHFLGLGFGSGLAKIAPGTFGTLVAFPLAWMGLALPLPIQWIIIAGLYLIGIPICTITGKALGVVDHGGIVWDEIVAMLLILTFSPVEWPWWLMAFLLFRLFDIWKPYPIRQCDAKLKNGFGVMFDDLLAAIYAIISLEMLMWITTNY